MRMNTGRHFPACFVQLPLSTEHRRASFYLAAEEWVARNLKADNYLFTWQLGRTVVMGRNQVAHQEVNLDFCKRNNIDIIRRKSGGGAIFADEGNIMISLVTPASMVEPLFQEYAETVADGLRKLGANVKVKGRNDVVLYPEETADGDCNVAAQAPRGKVCGNAFYHLADRNIVHGTMLYTTDPELLSGALHSNPVKLEAKGVQSVRARVGMLSEAHLHLPGDGGVKALRQRLRELFTDRTVTLGEEVIPEIETLEKAYFEPDYLWGSSSKDEVVRGCRVEGCGTVELHFALKGSIIKKVWLTGDYFETGDSQEAFTQAFTGLCFTPENLQKAIELHHPEKTIRNLDILNLNKILNHE